MIFFNKTKFVLKETFKLLLNNATRFLVCFVAFFLSVISIALFINGQALSDGLRKEIELSVFLKDNIEIEDYKNIESIVKNSQEIDTYTYMSKQDAEKRAKELFKNSPEILEAQSIVKNPYPASFEIRLKNADDVKLVADRFINITGVADKGIKYGEEYLDKILHTSKFVKILSIVGLVFFLTIAGFFILSIVNVSVANKVKECQIMHLIGASPLQIRMPFYLQSIITGLIAPLLAVLIFKGIYTFEISQIGILTIITTKNYLVMAFGISLQGILIAMLSTKYALRKILN